MSTSGGACPGVTRPVGGGDTGERSAVIYSIIESAQRHAGDYVKDVLERLLGMKVGEIDELLSAHGRPAGRAAAPRK